MKKLLLTAFVLISSVIITSAQSRWNIGLETGCVTNVSKYESGNETANALFSNNPHHTGRFAVNFRYKLSDKFSLQTGFDFTEFGFDYALAKDYSLLKPFERSNDISATTCITSVPVMAVINTPLNCTQKRWIFGLGAVVRGVDQKWQNEDFDEVPVSEAGNSKVTYMYSETQSTSSVSAAVTWMIGMEKVLKGGNSFTFTYRGTQGLGTIAESTVNYSVNDKNYTHTFINRGSFVSFAIGYNFMPFGTKKARKLSSAEATN